MPIRQKARRPTLQILGRTYGPRIVGLHNRFRMRTDRIIRYLDLEKDRRLSRIPYRGVFLPGRDRHRIYLRRGADELTLAHELMHGILYTEGFVGLRASRTDLEALPELGGLAGRLGDLLVHPVLLDRLRRARFPVAREEWLRGARSVLQFGGPNPPPIPSREAPARALLQRFSRAALLAEAILRHPSNRPALESIVGESEPGILHLALLLAEAAPWDSRRTGLRYRVAVGRLLGLLDREALDAGIRTALRDRVLLPPFLTPGRLDRAAGRFFRIEVRPSFPLQEARTGLILRFLLDGTAAAFRLYARQDQAERARRHLQDKIEGSTVGEFLLEHRIDAVLLERGGRARIRMADPDAAPHLSGS